MSSLQQVGTAGIHRRRAAASENVAMRRGHRADRPGAFNELSRALDRARQAAHDPNTASQADQPRRARRWWRRVVGRVKAAE